MNPMGEITNVCKGGLRMDLPLFTDRYQKFETEPPTVS
jgi:hypothetical protein